MQSFLIHLGSKSEAELLELVEPLRGRDLACFCPLGAMCHADVWLWLAEKERNLTVFCSSYAAATCKTCWAVAMMVAIFALKGVHHG